MKTKNLNEIFEEIQDKKINILAGINIKKELFYLIFLIIIFKKIKFYKFKNNIMLKIYFNYKYKNYYL